MVPSAAQPRQKSKTRKGPRKVAVVSEWCTGCGGVPVCAVYCRQNALSLVEDPHNPPFKTMTVDTGRCIGCGACLASGKDGIILSGCPWDAIRLEELGGSEETKEEEAA